MSHKGDLTMVIAMALANSYPPLITTSHEGDIEVDANRLSEAILSAGYSRSAGPGE